MPCHFKLLSNWSLHEPEYPHLGASNRIFVFILKPHTYIYTLAVCLLVCYYILNYRILILFDVEDMYVTLFSCFCNLFW